MDVLTRSVNRWRPLDQTRGHVLCALQVSLLISLQVSLLGVHGSAVFELKLASFSNPGGKTWAASPCPGNLRGPRTHRESDISYKFRFCLDETNGDVTTCRYGQWDTGTFETEATVAFGVDMEGVANPIIKTMTRWPGSVKFKVKVVCVDGQSSEDVESSASSNNQLVDLISTVLNQTPSKEKPVMTRVTVSGIRTKRPGPSKSTSLSFSWRVYCERDFYTTSCDQHCATPSPTDHYHCDETGTKLCDEGWTGDSCDTHADDCKSNPCQHGGECVDGDRTYTCVCQGDYTGARCETSLDTCRSSPCVHGATCRRAWGGTYWCECTPTYKGVHCETHKCTGEPCSNGATCVVLDGELRCRCTAGFVGAACDVDTCAYIACANNGTCARGRCNCLPGYIGEVCAHRDDPCDVHPCVETTDRDTATPFRPTLAVSLTVDDHTSAITRVGQGAKLNQVKRQAHKTLAVWILVPIVIAVVVVLIVVITVAAWLLLRANRRLLEQKAHLSLILTNSNSSTDTVSDYDENASVHRYASLSRYTSLFAGHPVALPPYDSVSHANTVGSGAYENPDYVDDLRQSFAGAQEETETGDARTSTDNNIGDSVTAGSGGDSSTPPPPPPANTEHVYLELISD